MPRPRSYCDCYTALAACFLLVFVIWAVVNNMEPAFVNPMIHPTSYIYSSLDSPLSQEEMRTYARNSLCPKILNFFTLETYLR